MKVLIVGSGGREHALAWKTAQSVEVTQIFVAPGNAGTATEHKVSNIDIAAENIPALIEFARSNDISLTIIGPEGPLALGIVDAFSAAGLACFGPRQNAAILEASKSFTKDFLHRHKIPTAAYAVFTDLEQAVNYLKQHPLPVVIKADGLAAGKGVVVAMSSAEALAAVTDMLQANKFGDAGHRVVIEEFLVGEEASFIVMCDGEHVLPMATSQDHKARDRGDRGPNTGGMGAYSPAPVVSRELHDKIMQQVIYPTIRGMKQEGRVYTGFLYAGLMISPTGDIKVLEFNCRFGDPETQPIMMRLKSNLAGLCLKAIAGRLDEANAEWDPRPALGIVLAAAGYPDTPRKGDPIQGLGNNTDHNAMVFHAGTRQDKNAVVTAGGRVLCVTALGDTVRAAQQTALKKVAEIHWDGMFYRDDIGYRAIARESS